jgi:hypothetical protein
MGQDVSGGRPVRAEGTDLPLWGMEIDVEAAKTDLREATGRDGGKGVDDFLGSVGLGVVSDQLKDLRLGASLCFEVAKHTMKTSTTIAAESPGAERGGLICRGHECGTLSTVL